MNAYAIPTVTSRRVQDPIAEYGEIIHWVRVSRDHPFKLARDVLDSQGGIQAGPLYYPPGVVAAARHLSDQEEAFLADAIGKLPHHVTERPQRFFAHVLGGVDAETVEIGVRDPEAVG